MKASTTLAAAVALFSTAYAASVKIEETPCIQNNTQLKSFDVEIGALVVAKLESVCGLKIVSATDADVAAVECQAFKDAEGKDPGSAKFTFAKPALIATNPVQEGSILCTVGGATSASTTITTLITATASGTGSAPAPTGGNSTVGTTGTPTQPSSPSGNPSGTVAPQQPGSAGRVGLSIGALAVGVAALVL